RFRTPPRPADPGGLKLCGRDPPRAVPRVMTQLGNSSSHSGRRSLARIGITMGDPAGIGPEVVLKAVAEEEIQRLCVPVIIGDAQLLAHTARTLNLQCGYDIVRPEEPLPIHLAEPVIFHLDNVGGHIEPGIESGAAGKAAAGYIEAAVELCAAGSIE